MTNFSEIKKEMYVIILAFLLLGIITVSSSLFILNQTAKIHSSTENIYNHPLKVSNAALNIKSEILKINKDIMDMTTVPSQKGLLALVKDEIVHERHIDENMAVIEKHILGDKGKKLYNDTKKLLDEYTKYSNELMNVIQAGQTEISVNNIKNRQLDYVLKLETSSSKIYMYAQKKANGFIKESDAFYEEFKVTEFLKISMLIILFTLIAYYVIQRTLKYMKKSEHLKGVLNVVRSVNQLIVREKNKQKLVDESCKILASKHVFSGAWIVLLDKDNKVEYISGTDPRSDFEYLKEKIRSGWTPNCVEETLKNNNTYCFIEKTKENCFACPLMDLYGGQGAFNIALKYNEEVFGYMTLSVDSKYIEYSDEIELLKEVSKDIAYAIKNIEIQNTVSDLKELYSNVIDSVENLIFVKDKDLNYIMCNKAFEMFIGKTIDEIAGKSDYDIVDKSTADIFRDNDIKMLASKKVKSNFEWVTYPDGKNVYLFTVKSPLINSKGKIIGLVGNSVDLTTQKNTEELLLESEERFKLLMKESPSVIEIYDLEGTQIEVNNAYEKLWQIPASLTLNKFNLFKSKEVEKSGLLEYIKRAYKGESVTVPIYEFDSRGHTEAQGMGRVRALNTRIYPLQDSLGNIKNIVLTHEDVTDKEKFIQQLEQKKRELETIIREAPNPIILHSDDGKIILLNQAWINATGYSTEDTPTSYDFVDKVYEDEDEKKRVKEHVKSLYSITSKINEGEFTFTNRNKEQVTWQFSSAPLGEIDGKRTIISSATDITELKKKDELMVAQSRHAAMGEMIGMIAHQWRQPISVVSMIANNMLLDLEMDVFDAKDVEKYSSDILEQTAHLSKTIDDFRNFFKPEKAKLTVKIKDVIDETLNIVKDSLINNDIEYKILNNAVSEVEVYQREVMQVFVNIITNAKDNFVQNNIKNAMLEISIYEDEEYVCTKICDNGGGIETEILPKIFDPYFTTKDEKTGTGLGLYMSKMIIEDHLKGVLEASNSDDGACFMVKLLKNKMQNND